MSVPAFKNSRSKVRRRRAHHSLKTMQHTACANCGEAVISHRACSKCGHYKGKFVAGAQEGIEKIIEKKTTKKSTEEEIANKKK